MISASAFTVSPIEVLSWNGRCERSASTISSNTNVVPKRAHWAFMRSISSGPMIPSGKPG